MRTNRRRSRGLEPDPALDRGHGGESGRSRRASSRTLGRVPRVIAIAAVLIGGGFAISQPAVLAQARDNAAAAGSGMVLRDLLIVLILVIVNSLFVLAETALLTVRRTRIEQLVEEGNKNARVVHALLSEPTRMLATLQVGVTLVQLFSAGAAAESAVGPFAGWLQTVAGRSAPFVTANAHAIAFVVIVLGVALLTLVIGEITPKSIAIRHAERIALMAARPLRLLQTLFTPLVSVVTMLAGILVRPFGGTPTFHASPMTEEELKLMVEQSEEHGVIEAEEREMIHSIFAFGDTIVRKVMTPRLDMTAVEADASVEELIRIVTESGHSRLPVFDDVLDNIVGIVHVKDVLQGISGDQGADSIRDLMRPPYFIPETKRVDDLLTEFQRSKTQVAIVRDEYGTVTGIVSVEDLLEEIVGEIRDEYDVEEEPTCTQIDDRTAIVDGRMELDDFNDRMGVELPIEESDTVGGFVFGLMGHQPGTGEVVSWDGLEFRVEETDGKRIQKVRVVKSPSLVQEGQADGSAAGEGEEEAV